MLTLKEKEIERSILDFLSSLDFFVFKINTVGVYDSERKVYRAPRSRHIIKGVSDILGIYNGKFLAIEVKTPQRRNQLSEEQKTFLKEINSRGGLAFVATGIDDVIKSLGLTSFRAT